MSSTFPEMIRNIFTQQTSAFRINVSFGFILRNVETGELRYYHPSQNNARFFDVPHLIRNEEDLDKFQDEYIGPGRGFECFPVFGWYSSVLGIVFWFPGPLVIY
jgi:hypothetical protein